MMQSSPQTEQPLIQATGVCVERAGRPILNDIDVSIGAGEIVTLVGLNGSGKSTLVRVLAGLMAPDDGSVKTRPGLRIGYCPQHLHRDPNLPMTARDFLCLSSKVAAEMISPVMEEVGIAGMQDQQLVNLSGGEFQRLVLARAMLRKPDLLILDEPLAGVDVTGQGELYELIPQLRDRYGCGVLLVSHDIHIVMASTDRVICLNHHVCCSGHPEAVAIHPEFVSLFGEQVAGTLAIYRHEHDHEHDLHGDEVHCHDA